MRVALPLPAGRRLPDLQFRHAIFAFFWKSVVQCVRQKDGKERAVADGELRGPGRTLIFPLFAVQAMGPVVESSHSLFSSIGITSVDSPAVGCAVVFVSSTRPAIRASGWGSQ